MPGHAPYLMPDGQSLSKYLTLENEGDSEKRRARAKRRQRKWHLRGKDEIWQHLKKQQSHAAETGYHSEHDEFGAAEKMGSRRRTRWINDRMLRDMTGPMTMDQIEAQFCPPPWGDAPSQNEPFHLLYAHYPSLWELLRNIDLQTEQSMIQELENGESKQNGRRHGAKGAMKSWHQISRRLRKFLKSASPTLVLERELQLIDFKNSTTERVCVVLGQSWYLMTIYEALCQFHDLKFRQIAGLREKDSADSTEPLYDLRIERMRAAPPEGSVHDGGVEVTCSDVLMACQEMKHERLDAKSLLKYVLTQIHGVDEDGLE